MAYDIETRDTLLDLLNRASSSDDATALAAARELAAKVEALDLEWESLLVPAQLPVRAPAPAASGSDAEIIQALLARDDLFPDTRDDLTGFLAAAEAGTLAAEDRSYVRALNQRLSQRSP